MIGQYLKSHPGCTVSERPRALNGQIEIRDVLDLTVAVDHNVVDGAPATRFAAELRALIERAAVLTPSK
jgi:pyruvate/2-oxoglutarate dehydrogenase complex dihydrolipoamide acyltransferase (E2) component